MVQVTADHIASRAGGEPQRQNNFFLEFGKYLEGSRLFVSGVSMPQYTANTEELRVGNLFKKYVTGIVYGDIAMTIYEIIDEEIAQQLETWWAKITSDGGETINVPADYKDDATLGWVDGCGQNKRSWTLMGVYPKDINFGQGTMNGSSPVEIQVTFSVDKIKRR